MILPGGRDLEHPSSLCAEAEASRDTFSALDDGFGQDSPAQFTLQLPLGRYQRIWSDVAREMLAGRLNKQKG